MVIIDISEPFTLLLIVLFTALMIFLGKETKRSFVPAISLAIYLMLIVSYVVQFVAMKPGQEPLVLPTLGMCMGIDFVLILLSYIGYLWVDDIETKANNKQSIDNSLDWLWKKV